MQDSSMTYWTTKQFANCHPEQPTLIFLFSVILPYQQKDILYIIIRRGQVYYFFSHTPYFFLICSYICWKLSSVAQGLWTTPGHFWNMYGCHFFLPYKEIYPVHIVTSQKIKLPWLLTEYTSECRSVVNSEKQGSVNV